MGNIKKTYCVYKHTSPSEKVYIGITCQKPEKRWNNGNGYKHNEYFWRAIQKYGWDNFEHEILFSDLSKEEAQVKEKNLINKYKSNIPEFGYNISSGGEARTGVKLSEDAKKKISEANKGRLAGEKILYMEFVVMEKITRFMGGHIRKTQKKKSEINALELTWQKKQSKKLAMQQKVKIILDMGK